MARQILDHTGNEDFGNTLAKLNAMFTELYAAAGDGGALTPATVVASGQVTAGNIKIGTGTKTASATGGAATLNKPSGVITSEALTTAAGAAYTLTITDSEIAATDQVLASAQNGTNTQGWLHVERVTPGSGSLVIVVRNIHASEALNGTIKVTFVSLNA